jgi:hypothetical protein
LTKIDILTGFGFFGIKFFLRRPFMNDSGQNDPQKDIIELSEIVVGTSADDHAIVEMTEGLVDEVRNAISGATGENGDDVREMDLADNSIDDNELILDDDEIIDLVDEIDPNTEFNPEEKIEDDDFSGLLDDMKEDSEDEIYIGEDDSTTRVPENDQKEILELTEVVEHVSDKDIREALKKVVEEKYGDMIDSILREIIWKKVSEDIDHLKEYLLSKKSGK